MDNGFQREAAAPRRLREDPEFAPTQQRMGPERVPRRNPSTDQKKIRRQMRQSSTKESSMSIEADLLAKLAAARTPADQRKASAELAAFRQTRTAQVRAEREIDFGAAVASQVLGQSAPSHQHHTASSDWLGEVEVDVPDTRAVEANMRAEATVWYNRLHTAVKADKGEVDAQARGMAVRTASQYGTAAEGAAQAFYNHVRHLAGLGQVVAEEKVTQDPDTFHLPSGSSLPDAGGDKDTFDDSLWTPSGGGDQTSTQADKGDTPSLSEGDSPEGGHSEGVENPAVDTTHDAGPGETGYEDPLTSGGKTSARKVADDQTSTEADKGDTPSLGEGSAPEGDHSEPVVENFPSGDHNAAPGEMDATDSIDGTLYRKQTSLQSIAASIAVEPQSQPFVASMARLGSVEDSFGGVPGRDIVGFVLRTAALTPEQRTALQAHLDGVVPPFSAEASDGVPNRAKTEDDPQTNDLTCPSCHGTFSTGELADGQKVEAGDRCYDCQGGTLVKKSSRKQAAGPEDQADAAVGRWDKHEDTFTSWGREWTFDQASQRLYELQEETRKYGPSDDRRTEQVTLSKDLAAAKSKAAGTTASLTLDPTFASRVKTALDH